jgi:hypothetical protein
LRILGGMEVMAEGHSEETRKRLEDLEHKTEDLIQKARSAYRYRSGPPPPLPVGSAKPSPSSAGRCTAPADRPGNRDPQRKAAHHMVAMVATGLAEHPPRRGDATGGRLSCWRVAGPVVSDQVAVYARDAKLHQAMRDLGCRSGRSHRSAPSATLRSIPTQCVLRLRPCKGRHQ